MKELDELDKQKSLYQLMTKLNEAETSIREKRTISADELEAELADALDLGSSGQPPCRFKSCHPHEKRPSWVFFSCGWRH